MKLVFLGSGTIGLASLRALADAGLAPSLVVTQPPRRRGRRGQPEPTPVQRGAEEAGLAVMSPGSVNTPEALDRLRAVGADLFVVAEFGQILSEDLLRIPPLGAINMHTSLLPRHRGASPVVAAILAGDAETGVSIQRVVRKLDAGAVLAEKRIAIDPAENSAELSARLAPLGAELVVEVAKAFAAGNPPIGREQDESRVTLCRRLKPEDGRIDWARPAVEIARLVRAMTPKPGARTARGERGLLVRCARAIEGAGAPGVVVALHAEGFDVGSGEGVVRVLEVVPASRKPMSARDFVHGYRISVGERLR